MKANDILPDDDHDLRIREGQTACIHGHLLPGLDATLCHRTASDADLDIEPMDYIRYLDDTLVIPNSAPYPGGLGQPDIELRSHEDSVGRTVQYVCASTIDHQQQHLSRE